MNSLMNCHQFYELIDIYLRDTLEESEHTSFEAHLHSCEDCRAEFDSARLINISMSAYVNKPTPESEARKRSNFNIIKAKIAQDEREAIEAEPFIFSSWLNRVVRRWIIIPLPIGLVAAGLLFMSTTGFKDPLVDFVVKSHEQQWPTEVKTDQLTAVASWFATQSDEVTPLHIPRFHRLSNAKVQLDMARLSLVMVGPQRWERGAHLLYRFDRDEKVTVLAFHGAKRSIEGGKIYSLRGVSIQIIPSGKLNVAHYERGQVSFVVTSRLHKNELLKLIDADLRP